MDSNKKKIAIIATAALLAAATGAGVIVWSASNQPASQPQTSEPFDTTDSPDYEDHGQNDSSTNANTETVTSTTSNTTKDPGVNISSSSSSTAGDQGEYGEDSAKASMIAGVDKEKTAALAKDFLAAYTTFTSSSLSDGSWRAKVGAFVDDGKLKGSSGNGNELYVRYGDPSWAVSCGKTLGFDSYFESAGEPYVYISDATGSNRVSARIEVIYTATTGTPDSGANWDTVNRYKTSYLVGFDDSGTKVVSCAAQKTDTVDHNINGTNEKAWG